MAGDVPLHAVVEGDHLLAGPGRRPGGHLAPLRRLAERRGPLVERLRPEAGGGGHHLADQVAAHERGRLAGQRHEPGGIEQLARDHARHSAADPQPADEGPGVDPGQAHDAGLGEVVAERAGGREVAGDPAGLTDDEARHLQLSALDVRGVHPVVADLGRGHAEDLTAVGGVGEDLLVARHRGVEADLAGNGAAGTEGVADKDRAVLEGECRACHGLSLLGPKGGGGPEPVAAAAAHDTARRGGRTGRSHLAVNPPSPP
jgi:hypothetical protein